MSTLPYRFQLFRHHDVSGVSGTGVVAHGCLYPTGAITLCWLSATPSIVVFTNIDDLQAVHGHGGATEIIWIDTMSRRTAPAVAGNAVERGASAGGS